MVDYNKLSGKWKHILECYGLLKIFNKFPENVKILLLDKLENMLSSKITVDAYLENLLLKLTTRLVEIDESDLEVNFRILEQKYDPITENIVYKHSDGNWYNIEMLKNIKSKNVLEKLKLEELI